MVEIYCTDAQWEAEAILAEVLEPQGIECVIRDRTNHALPTQTMAGGFFLAVPEDQANRARLLLKEAKEQKLVPAEGTLL